MKIVADLHIHSHFSRATSKNLTFEYLSLWAQLKGVHVVGTGDIAHPGWLKEMREKLVPAEEGLFRLRDDLADAVQAETPPACRGVVRFMLGGEISNIYKKAGRSGEARTRKVHNVVFAPSLDAVERLQARLEKIGNIRADGRPILGLDSRDLLETLLDADPECKLIPAHIWTPWFSLLGSKSGFDTVEECYGDLTPHIFALETGLSSDPPMNWRVSGLDGYTLVSNSDAHSPEKLAREATLFDTELSYPALFAALEQGEGPAFGGTVEFFPEEGKYHLDGHRKCGVVWEPAVTLAHGGVCPGCGKEVTVGVMHRVEALADRPVGGRPDRVAPYVSLIPLPEVLSEVYGVGAGSKQVGAEYAKLLARLGPDLTILRDAPLAEIAAAGGERLAEGIGRMRRGEVVAEAGYDGEYGVIRLFRAAALPAADGAQFSLFAEDGPEPEAPSAGDASSGVSSRAPAQDASTDDSSSSGVSRAPAAEQPERRPAEGRPESKAPSTGDASSAVLSRPPAQDASTDHLSSSGVSRAPAAEQPERRPAEGGPESKAPSTGDASSGVSSRAPAQDASTDDSPSSGVSRAPAQDAAEGLLAGLNPAQRAAALCIDAPLVIVAGPGTGKTHTLAVRIAHLIRAHGVAPEAILAITFTNKAAAEMTGRLAALLDAATAARVTVSTFHAFGAQLLRAWAAEAALDPEFVICTEADRPALLREAARALSDSPPSPAEVERLLARISDAKNRLQGPADVAAAGDADLSAIYARYEAALQDNAALDFDDLLLRAVRLLEARPEALAAVQARYRWISVDEYQDVNLAQVRLLRLLAAGGANLCVIGDPDQAIYGFRGADRSYFLTFQQDYPAARLLRLSENYRSTQLILDAAVQVLAARRGEQPPSLRAVEALAEFSEQVRLDTHRAATDRAEAEYVVHQIEQMVGGTSYFSVDSGRLDGATGAERAFGDFAVLYRLGAQSRALIEAFDRSGIPYQCAGHAALTADAAVYQILAHLWLTVQPRSKVHLAAALAAGKPAFPAAAQASVTAAFTRLARGQGPSVAFDAAAAADGFSAAQRARLRSLARFYEELTPAAPLAGLVQQTVAFVAGEPAGRVPELLRRAQSSSLDLRAFLQDLALRGETDDYDPRADRVALLTLHAAKGLEFPVVFIVGCEEGLLPYERPGAAAADVEEERRLFYVGMTRAQQKLVLTSARTRFLFGLRMQNPPSRFVSDIEDALKQAREMAPGRARKKPENEQLSLF
ncbi:MAG: ATP-dependent DNA helicase PcrA [Chloroflexi bacterium ADurb.Bin325]|nr:MAG: ATP-dependent DNA helicase PcrA [Chloroflexi bacterium ADurb.Bin325]